MLVSIPRELIEQIRNDVEWINSRASFDGILVKRHLEQVLSFKSNRLVDDKVKQVLKMYRHDGGQCFSEEDRSRLIKIFDEILELLSK